MPSKSGLNHIIKQVDGILLGAETTWPSSCPPSLTLSCLSTDESSRRVKEPNPRLSPLLSPEELEHQRKVVSF